jgi:hypothetical protein
VDETTVAQVGVLGGSVPVLIVDGQHDHQANTPPPRPSDRPPSPERTFSVRALYDAIAGPHKLMVKVLGTRHHLPWERQHKNLHNLSMHWIEHRQVDGKTTGMFVMDENGIITPTPEHLAAPGHERSGAARSSGQPCADVSTASRAGAIRPICHGREPHPGGRPRPTRARCPRAAPSTPGAPYRV